jgi:hypothetical protein
LLGSLSGSPTTKIGCCGLITCTPYTKFIKETYVKHNQADSLKTTFGLKQQTKIGCWNVCTLRESGRLKKVEKVMSDYGVEIIRLSEVRWKDFGEITTRNGNTFLYSGPSADDVGV